MTYIDLQWGGEEEYMAELTAGNMNARNWKKHAHEVVEQTVCGLCFHITLCYVNSAL